MTSQIKNYKIMNYTLFFLFILIIIIKSPCTLYLGRSENGLEVFYNFALENSFIDTLFYVYSEAKYFELWTNLSAIIVSLVPFESYFVTVYLALVIKVLLLYYIFFCNSSLLISTFHKLLFASFSIFSTGITPEIWLTTLHSKNFFAILTFLMFFQNFNDFNRKKYFIYRLGLILNGFSSIYSSILAPLFFYKYIIEKKKNYFYNFVSSAIPLITNLYIFFYFSLKPSAINDRFVIELDKIINLIYSVFIRPILGGNLSNIIFKNFNFTDLKVLVLILFSITIFFIVSLVYCFRKKDQTINFILLALFLNIFLILLGAQYPNFAGGRYAVLSSIIFLTLFLRLLQIENKTFLNHSFFAIIFVSLAIGLAEFRHFNQWMYLLKC